MKLGVLEKSSGLNLFGILKLTVLQNTEHSAKPWSNFVSHTTKK